MPKKAVQKPTEETAAVAAVAPTPAKKPRGKKAQAAVETTVTEPTVTESVVETTVTESAVSESKKSRHVPTKETVEKEFDGLIESLDAEIQRLRESSTKSKGVKFLRTVNKNLKTLKNHALRISRQRSTTRRVNSNSGFNKQVSVSKELAKFMNMDPAATVSRKDVTKFLCAYIREHNLQLPADKRNIMVEKDAKLKALLKYDGKDEKPLTYPRLQTYLKSHYLPSSTASTPSSSVSSVKSPAPKKATK